METSNAAKSGENLDSAVSKPLACFRCGESGHLVKECKTKSFVFIVVGTMYISQRGVVYATDHTRC